MTETKNNKQAAPIRRRKWLVARRWCFFIMIVFAILFCVIWCNTHCGPFCRTLAWILFGIWLFTIVQVIYCKFFPPIITPLMVQRYIQQRKKSGSKPRFEWKYVPIDKISPVMVDAADVAENIGVYMYGRGFLFKALRRAYLLNRTSSTLCGGSTISQQTAKNCFLPHSRTLFRKVLEAYYVMLIELFWGKKHIMECYLNIIEYGSGIYGCEAASQHYFHHSAASLTEDEAVMLAASLSWPLRANPDNHTPYYDHYIESVRSHLHRHEPINWNVRYEDMDMQKLEEGNQGLLFFVKWWCLQQIRKK